MLSPRDIYPPEWFNSEFASAPSSRTNQGKILSMRRGIRKPSYARQKLQSGCVLIILCSTAEVELLPDDQDGIA